MLSSTLPAPDTKLISHLDRKLPLVLLAKTGRIQSQACDSTLFGSAILVRGNDRGEAGDVSSILNMRESLV